MIARSASALLLLAACGDDGPPQFAEPVLVEVASFPAVPATELDLLFVIDDSTDLEMTTTLAAQVGVLLDRLAAVPGGAPSFHAGVVTSDLGTTGSLDPDNPAPAIGTLGQGGCAGRGKDGALQMSGVPVTGTFVVDEPDGQGGRRTNYTGELATVLDAMLSIGAGGCGFEQSFAALRRGLSNPANAGFLRTSAQLAIVMLADEDDCSFLTPAFLGRDTAGLGPLESFRCTSQGVVCDQPIDEPGDKTGCVANEASPYVEPVGLTIDFLRALKPDPSMVHVGAIVGDPSPFRVTSLPGPGGGPSSLALGGGCRHTGSTGLTVAHPAVRARDLVDAFESRAVLGSICSADFTPTLRSIARTITPAFGVTCIDTTRLADASSEPGVQPTCEVVIDRAGERTPLAACSPDGGDCYELVADEVACPDSADHARFVTRWTTPPAGAYVRVRCEPWPPP